MTTVVVVGDAHDPGHAMGLGSGLLTAWILAFIPTLSSAGFEVTGGRVYHESCSRCCCNECHVRAGVG